MEGASWEEQKRRRNRLNALPARRDKVLAAIEAAEARRRSDRGARTRSPGFFQRTPEDEVEALEREDAELDVADRAMARRVGRHREGDCHVTEPAAPDLPFEHLGDYDVLAPISEGGMASVWLGRPTARPTELVALKVIRPEHGRNKEFVAMLVDEAAIASRLSHPNILSIRALGHDGKQYFLVMELLRGHTLLETWKAAHAQGKHLPDRGRRVDRRTGRRRSPVRARAEGRRGDADERRAPRRQPGEHLHHAGGSAQAHRLRARQGARPHRVDRHRRRQGKARLPRARAGARKAGRPRAPTSSRSA